MDKIRLTSVIIARNEGIRIGKCLASLDFSDEVIVIDNGSSDNTAQIAGDSGAKVISSDSADFSVLRNLGKDKARGKWLLYVDADETVTPGLGREIRQVIGRDHSASGPSAYRIIRVNSYFGKPWPHRDRLERLFRKDKLVKWYGPVHESPTVDGAVGDLGGVLEHDTHRSLTEMVAKTNEWSETEARLRFAAGHPPVSWWRIFRVMLTGFWDSYIRQGGWKAGATGLIESVYQSFSMFVTYAKLWELQQGKRRE